MSGASLEERAQSVFRRVFDDATLTIGRATTAYDLEDWDSLAHLQLILGMEKEFQVKITAKEALGVRNVGEFVDLIATKLKGAAS
ncbi:MAG: acyl carrier protein [Acidobacteria bacterium]|nr:acyl carrier protein [Acidobacteriota bacterium]